MMCRLDRVLSNDNTAEELLRLKPEVDRINAFPVSEKIQLELPTGLIKLKFWNSLRYLLTRR